MRIYYDAYWDTPAQTLGYYYYPSTNTIESSSNISYYGIAISITSGKTYHVILKGNETSTQYNPSSGVYRKYLKTCSSNFSNVANLTGYTSTYDSTSNTTTISFTASTSGYLIYSLFRSSATSSNPTINYFNSLYQDAERYNPAAWQSITGKAYMYNGTTWNNNNARKYFSMLGIWSAY